MSNFRRRLMCKKSESDLPSGYTRLNYLESTGTQYIDIGITPYELRNKQLFLDYQITDNFSKNFRLFGAYDNTQQYGFCQIFANTNIENMGLQWGTPVFNDYIPKNNLRHSLFIDCLNKKMNIDGHVYYITINPYYSIHINSYLFCRNSNSIPDNFASLKIYNFIIQKYDELFLNFMPALDHNKRPCLYDTVSQQPFYNQGTGEFLYG